MYLLAGVAAFAYYKLWRVHKGDYGRWYWNYGLSIHPFLLYLMPKGDWGHVEGTPRWVEEVYHAPWMGEFQPPALSPPVYDAGRVISPAILKLHVFSTVTIDAYAKRRLIRKHSPLLNLPEEYRHLVEMRFVLGHAYNEDGTVDTELEVLLAEEGRVHDDLIRLDLLHGENLREGKILDWIHAAGTGEDGGRPAWYLFKCDDDVSGGLGSRC